MPKKDFEVKEVFPPEDQSLDRWLIYDFEPKLYDSCGWLIHHIRVIIYKQDFQNHHKFLLGIKSFGNKFRYQIKGSIHFYGTQYYSRVLTTGELICGNFKAFVEEIKDIIYTIVWSEKIG